MEGSTPPDVPAPSARVNAYVWQGSVLNPGALVGSATTNASGYYRIMGLAPGVAIMIDIPYQTRWLVSGGGPQEVCGGIISRSPTYSTIEWLTGLSVREGGLYTAPLTITWPSHSRATSYCVSLLRKATNTEIESATCTGATNPDYAGYRQITAPRYTTTALSPGEYFLTVLAVVGGEHVALQWVRFTLN